jgi:hypothetical protein
MYFTPPLQLRPSYGNSSSRRMSAPAPYMASGPCGPHPYADPYGANAAAAAAAAAALGVGPGGAVGPGGFLPPQALLFPLPGPGDVCAYAAPFSPPMGGMPPPHLARLPGSPSFHPRAGSSPGGPGPHRGGSGFHPATWPLGGGGGYGHGYGRPGGGAPRPATASPRASAGDGAAPGAGDGSGGERCSPPPAAQAAPPAGDDAEPPEGKPHVLVPPPGDSGAPPPLDSRLQAVLDAAAAAAAATGVLVPIPGPPGTELPAAPSVVVEGTAAYEVPLQAVLLPQPAFAPPPALQPRRSGSPLSANGSGGAGSSPHTPLGPRGAPPAGPAGGRAPYNSSNGYGPRGGGGSGGGGGGFNGGGRGGPHSWPHPGRRYGPGGRGGPFRGPPPGPPPFMPVPGLIVPAAPYALAPGRPPSPSGPLPTPLGPAAPLALARPGVLQVPLPHLAGAAYAAGMPVAPGAPGAPFPFSPGSPTAPPAPGAPAGGFAPETPSPVKFIKTATRVVPCVELNGCVYFPTPPREPAAAGAAGGGAPPGEAAAGGKGGGGGVPLPSPVAQGAEAAGPGANKEAVTIHQAGDEAPQGAEQQEGGAEACPAPSEAAACQA